MVAQDLLQEPISPFSTSIDIWMARGRPLFAERIYVIYTFFLYFSQSLSLSLSVCRLLPSLFVYTTTPSPLFRSHSHALSIRACSLFVYIRMYIILYYITYIIIHVGIQFFFELSYGNKTRVLSALIYVCVCVCVYTLVTNDGQVPHIGEIIQNKQCA